MSKLEKMDLRSDFRIFIHFTKLAHKISPGFISAMVFSSIIKAIYPFINIIMPKYIIDELMNQHNINKLTFYVFIMAFLDLLLYVLISISEELIIVKNEKLMLDFELNIGKHIMKTNYSNLEDTEFIELQYKALFPILRQGVLLQMFKESGEFFTLIFTQIGLIAIISTLNFFIIFIIIFSSFLYVYSYKKLKHVAYMFTQELIKINRKFTYYIELITDYSKSKDIRLYNMEPLISHKIETYNNETYDLLGKLCSKNGKYGVISKFNLSIQSIIIMVTQHSQFLEEL